MTEKKKTKKLVKGQTSSSQAQETTPSPLPDFPIVGIGASAGGLAAFESFFSGMPADSDSGMAFILVQHLAPDHKSILTNLIRKYTRMQVFEVEDGIVVQPNCTYIIPPNCDMAFLNGSLQLFEPSAPRGQRMPIDFFFRSLALDQHERAIGVVLSGTGSDGSQGVRAIKGEGGMVIAQNPENAEYDGMPRSAIATGLVDYELAPAEMPTRIMAYVSGVFRTPLGLVTALRPQAENALKKIFLLVRNQTGHDFSQYKSSTINRRIERRMVVHQIDTIDAYIKFLQETPAEVEALFRDLLIGVTNFFRDPEAFKALEEQVIPKLFAGKPAGSVIRVWVPACSTGEEAYSIAILLQEHLEGLKQRFQLQIFATDIDGQAIVAARAGMYPSSIAADISPERLARFFAPGLNGSAYRIHKSIREMLVFSEQDVIKDPPFLKLDLISCRNLMIYLSTDLQNKLIPLFHYALNPGGMLFLGTSETVGDYHTMFSTLDRKMKLYMRDPYLRGTQLKELTRFIPPLSSNAGPGQRKDGKPAAPVKLQLRELTEQALLKEIAPAGALVNRHGDILYLHGRTGLYLELPQGEVGVNNILKMAREGLRPVLTTALRKAVLENGVVQCPRVRVKTNGDFTTVDLTIRPVTIFAAETLTEPLFLVVLKEALPLEPGTGEVSTAKENPALDTEARTAALKLELQVKDEYLQSTNQELEIANGELKSSNEEMQSLNEELQSTNEELETSKEELQSINEELSSVNVELQTRNDEMGRVYNDMNNLLSGTGIGTVFVDHQLKILRFTPTATDIINLINGDIGRSVGHIVSNLVSYDSLVADVQAVLDTLIPREVEVQTKNGSWYTLRIQPYRTIANVIEGAVITFVDITEMKQAREALKESEGLRRLATVVRDAHDAIAVQDLEGCILAWNPGAQRMYGWSETEALKMNIRDLIAHGDHQQELKAVKSMSKAGVLKPYRSKRVTKEGRILDVWLTATALVDDSGKVYAIATTERASGFEEEK
jgi:two-component system CheB/CheR fusion protein